MITGQAQSRTRFSQTELAIQGHLSPHKKPDLPQPWPLSSMGTVLEAWTQC